MKDLETRFADVEALMTTLEQYEQPTPREAVAQIRAIVYTRDTLMLPRLISLTQVDVLEADPKNLILATTALTVMAHYSFQELTEALRTFLSQNTVTLPGSKIGILKIIQMLPEDTFAEPILHEYTQDTSARVKREAEWILRNRDLLFR